MLQKKAKYKKVKVLQKQIVEDAVYGCDHCQKELKEKKEINKLEMTVFHKPGTDPTTLDFCSWDCVLAYLPKIDNATFIDLPFVYYDLNNKSKISREHLVKLIIESNILQKKK